MNQRLFGSGAALLAAFALPGPSRLVASGWLGERPSFFMLLLLAAVAFAAIAGGTMMIWKLLTNEWPPRQVVGVLFVVLAVRLVVDVVRMMGLWLI